MKAKKLALKKNRTKQIVMIKTHNIVHTCLDVSVIKYVADIPRSTCNKKPRQSVQRQPICISDAGHDYILDEIERCDNIEYEIHMHNDDK